MSDVDYYELLDVPPTATAAEIKDAYRRAVRTAHPDAGGSSGMFHLITAAYETLSDPVRRADYDAGLVRPGARITDDRAHTSDMGAGDPGWGDETAWDASDGRPDPVASMYANDWVNGKRGLVVIAVLWAAVGVIFALGVVLLLYAPEWLRPGAAEPDLLSWYGDHAAVRLVALVAYVAILASVWTDSARAVVAVHTAFALLLVGWAVAYWGIATASERWWFGGGVGLWLLYNVLLAVAVHLSLVRSEYSMFQRGSGSPRVTALTRWARTGAGRVAVRAGCAVIGATFLFLTVVLLFAHGLLRPAAAGPDALDIALRYPVAVAVVVAAYAYLAYISIGHRGGLELLYLPAAFCLLAWPLAYWDIATSGERWLFGLVTFAWVLHVVAMYATSSLIDRRRTTPEWTR